MANKNWTFDNKNGNSLFSNMNTFQDLFVIFQHLTITNIGENIEDRKEYLSRGYNSLHYVIDCS